MHEDELLKALSKIAREGDVLADPRWPALTEGTLADAEADELAAHAAGSDELREAFEAFRPLDDEARARTAARIVAELQAAATAPITEAADEIPIVDAPPPALGVSPPAAVTPGSAPPRRWALVSSAALALCIGLFAAFGSMRGGGARPPYGMTVTGGERSARSTPDTPGAPGSIRLSPASRLEIVLRPASAATGPIAARAFLVRDGHARDWQVPVTLAESGAVRVQGSKEALFAGVEDGRWEMVFAVGSPEALPSTQAIEAALSAGDREPHPGYQLLRREITLRSTDEDDPPERAARPPGAEPR